MKFFKTGISALALSLVLMASSAFAADHKVEIKGMKFSPSTLTVATGDTVTFTNVDRAPHTATAKDGSFDTGRLKKGESATVDIAAAGTFDYFCQVHPSMKAEVTAN